MHSLVPSEGFQATTELSKIGVAAIASSSIRVHKRNVTQTYSVLRQAGFAATKPENLKCCRR